MYRFRSIILVIAAVVCFAKSANSQARYPNNIYLKGQTINADNNAAFWVKNEQSKVKYPTQLLLQFERMPDEQEKLKLKEFGVVLLDYIPDRAYTAISYHSLTEDFFVLNNIRYVSLLQYSWKVAKDVQQEIRNGGKEVEVNISIADGIAKSEIETLIANIGGAIIEDRQDALGYLVVRVPRMKFAEIEQAYWVKYISLYKEEAPLNWATKSITRMREASAPINLGGYGLLGKGVSIGIGDNYSGVQHVDLRDRVINYVPAPYNYHGLHISGIAGGAGIMDVKGRGAAPESILSSHYFSEVLNATPSIYKSNNVTVTNNSYSARAGNCDYTGTYDNLSASVDVLSNNYSEVLHVFASANNGRFDCTPYPTGYGTVAGGYQVSKNGLVVTSCNKEYVNAETGSRGPVLDGRLKPEISTVGIGVYSTTYTEDYLYALGTSMASPNVAGGAALLTELYKQKNSNTNPKADLIKALLMNGATDIGNKGPDYRFGFGFLNMEHSLIMLDSNRYVENNVATGNQESTTITVPAGLKKLKVMLYWHDAPASAMASKQLVNDLDLSVVTPTNITHRPLVLDPTPSNILNDAKEGEDHLNNCEQVTIDNPAAGSYTVNVRAGTLPSGFQRYVLVYDFVEDNIAMKYPRLGAQVLAGDSLFVYWDAFDEGNTYTLEYSINNGGIWTTLDNAIPASQKHYVWVVPENISSGRCLMRVTRNNTTQTSTTGLFAINPKLDVKLSDNQCPGYMQIEWPSLSNATAYEVMWKNGVGMEVVDTVSTLNYTFNGLSTSEVYYAAVRPIIDGIGGYRSRAVRRQPNDGDCNGTISDNDLMIDRVISPSTGRVNTSTELSATTNIRVTIYNLDDAVCDSAKLHYRVDGGTWMSQTFTDPFPAKGKKTITISGLDFSAVADYVLDIAIEHLGNTDPVNKNDSATIYFSQLPNNVITLEHVNAFDGFAPFTITKDTIGIGENRRWDFVNLTKGGRLRNYVLDNVLISGTRSISMDAIANDGEKRNSFMGTFNLSNYNANTDELRLEFDYIVHGTPKQQTGNSVMVRGADDKLLQELYQFKTDASSVGRVLNSGSLSVSDVMLANNDNYTSSSQIMFSQNDTSVIARRNFGNGVTIDDVRIYTVKNDIQLISVDAPASSLCGVTGPSPLTITIRNGVSQTLNNVQLNYRLDGNAIISEQLSSIAGKQTMQYTFNQNIDITQSGSHKLDVWLVANGDTYRKNDSILNYVLRNQPEIVQFPYFEDFETSDGFWYTDGTNSTWEYGTPVAQKINKAASGTKAWVTNLDGNYNDYETSYLYSPCFDITGLENPTLSFKMAQDIENCGAIYCDGAYLEYTVDGNAWQRLGRHGDGVNWYVDSNFQAWNIQDRTDWHQASIPLPDTFSNVQFRFVLKSDPGANFEGLGIDDVKIYSELFYLGTDDVLSISPNPTVNGNICIEWAANSGKTMKIAITDLTGKLVYTSETIAVQGYNKTCLQTPMFSTGMYFMRIIIGDKEHKRKIVYLRR